MRAVQAVGPPRKFVVGRTISLGRVLKISGYAIVVLGLVDTGTFILQPLFGLAGLASLLFAGWLTALAVALIRQHRVAVG